MALLDVRDLKIAFYDTTPPTEVVKGISFSLEEGETLGIVGESGSGKTQTALSILHLLKENSAVSGGEILYEDSSVAHASSQDLQRIRGKEISMIFQEPMTSLNPVFTVGYQLCEPLRFHLHMTKAEAEKRAVELLRMVGLSSPEKRVLQYPHQLSGGMRQRVMIAMAMVCKPKLLIADEPTTALDVTIEAQILRLMKELRDETGMSVLIITHNMGVVAEICDYVYVMYAGKIMEQAETFELFDHTMHPYTRGLLDSIPRIGQNAERLHTIPGVVPNLLHLSQGCPFSNRCEYATDQCRTEKAQLHPVAPDHQVRCFRCEEEHQ